MSPNTLFTRRYTAPGAAPGEFNAPTSSEPVAYRLIQWDAKAFVETTLNSVEDVANVKRGKITTWIDIAGRLDGDSLTTLGEHFGLHPLAIADVANLGQRPKIDAYEDHLFCVLRMATYTIEHGVNWEQVSLFLGKDFVITFQETSEDCLDPLRERIRKGKKLIRTSGHGYLTAMVLDAIVDGYFPILEIYGDDLEDLEREVMTNPARDDLNEIYRIKRELMAFRRASWPLRDTLTSTVRDVPALMGKEVGHYLRDTADHLMQVVDIVETYRELSTSFIDVYMSSVSFRTNEVMRLLTVMASIFIPLTFIAGVYGMNFDTTHSLNMPELSWQYGYAAFWLFSVLVGGALTAMFHRLGWLGRPE